MGVQVNIDYDKFPKQGKLLGKRVAVMYRYTDPKQGEPRPKGTIVRDDMEEPFLTIIQLDPDDDGFQRFILATECQYRVLGKVSWM